MPDPREPQFVDLIWLLEMTHEQYLDRFRGTAVRRAKHWMLQRNAAVALGNTGGTAALEPLIRAMTENEQPIVRGHAAWAIGRLGGRLRLAECQPALLRALEREPNPMVCQEIQLAIEDLVGPVDSEDIHGALPE